MSSGIMLTSTGDVGYIVGDDPEAVDDSMIINAITAYSGAVSFVPIPVPEFIPGDVLIRAYSVLDDDGTVVGRLITGEPSHIAAAFQTLGVVNQIGTAFRIGATLRQR